MFEELTLSGFGRDYLEGIFNAGRIECVILGFEEAATFHFLTVSVSGRFVSVDRNVDLNWTNTSGRARRRSRLDRRCLEFDFTTDSENYTAIWPGFGPDRTECFQD